MTLSAPDIARLSAWLAETDLAELELRGPGCHLRLRLRQDAGHVTPIAEPVTLHSVTSPSVGVFLPAHPLHDTLLAPAGTLVEAGQPVALLRIGALLLPVTAPVPGIVAEILATSGATVGYGTPLVALHPVAE